MAGCSAGSVAHSDAASQDAFDGSSVEEHMTGAGALALFRLQGK